jgi:hypothetical protein
MISQEQARTIAGSVVFELSRNVPLQLDPEVMDMARHWVFFYNSVEFYQSGDTGRSVVGGGPIAVAKDDGQVMRLNGRGRIEDQLLEG